MKPISFSEERDIYQNKFLRLYSVEADFGEFSKEYFLVDKGQRAGTIVLRDDNVLLVSQYRFLVNGMSWELPGGGRSNGETYEQAAIRECKEEAGITCHSLEQVFRYQQGIETTIAPAQIFKCTNFSESPEFENEETDERRWFPVTDALEMIMDGRIADSMTIIGLLAFDRLSNRS